MCTMPFQVDETTQEQQQNERERAIRDCRPSPGLVMCGVCVVLCGVCVVLCGVCVLVRYVINKRYN